MHISKERGLVMKQARSVSDPMPFADSVDQFHRVVNFLQSAEAVQMRHSDLEDCIQTEGWELLRLLFQDHLFLRASNERDNGLSGRVVGSDGIERTHRRESGRKLMSIFGPVYAERIAYGGRGVGKLHPMDAQLNLPRELYSHGFGRRVCEEAVKNSFDEVVKAIDRTTGGSIGKRQAEELAESHACDFEAFYETREQHSPLQVEQTGSVLALSTDGKGVVVYEEDLREQTRKAARRRKRKLGKRISKGEKRNRKRMATVATVYTVEPFVRGVEDVVSELRGLEDVSCKKKRPRPENKRVWASLIQEPEEVIGQMFAEALRQDPQRTKSWVALVDGNETQLDLLVQWAKKYKVELTIILDVIHVLGYVWKAAYAFLGEGNPQAEQWVTKRLVEILKGRSPLVAAGIRRSATLQGLSAKARKPVDKCADYLIKYKDYLHYNEYLRRGFPIATGVIEGACRHLVKDRMDLTGARWRLKGAEAVLRLRALYCSGDFDEYWKFHQEQEFQRNHAVRYSGGPPRTMVPVSKTSNRRSYLHLIK